MSPSKPTDPKITSAASLTLHTTQPNAEFDVGHAAWAEFDLYMDMEIAMREVQLGHYLTRQAVRTSLGR